MLNVFMDNLTFIIIGLSMIIFIIIAYFFIVKPSTYMKNDQVSPQTPDEIDEQVSRSKPAHPHLNQKPSEKPIVKIDSDEEEEDLEEDFMAEPVEETSNDDEARDEKILTADELLKDINQEKVESTQSMNQPSTVEESKQSDKNSNEPSKDEQDNKDDGKYHVLYREEDDMWYVKREHAKRNLRVLHTKKEAIAYATIKAINQDTNIVIHGKDGKIEKHGY